MAKNLKQLPAGAPIESTDLLYVVRPGDPDSTADKQAGILDVINYGRAYGQMNLAPGTNPTQAVTATPTTVTAYDNVALAVGMTASDTAGTITIDAGTPGNVGTFSFSVSGSYSANAVLNFAIYVNSAITGIAGIIDLSNNNIDAGSLSASGVAVYNTNDVIDLRIWADVAGTFTFSSLLFGVSSS